MAVDERERTYEHPLYQHVERMPGVSVALGSIDQLLTWGSANSLWIFPMATSCCGIEFMAAAASGVDLDRMGSIPRGTPRQCDVMVVAGTITVKMAPRVKKLWEQMPEPKWCVAMGSCAISGDFYRDIYSVIPGIDTFVPVDVYVPGCPPNPEALMHGLLRLQEKIRMVREGTLTREEVRPESPPNLNRPAIGRLQDAERDPLTDQEQTDSAAGLGFGDTLNLVQIRRPRPEPETRLSDETSTPPETGAEAPARQEAESEPPAPRGTDADGESAP
ncbi:MAG: NADH-quinone oxidoreductase subunit B [Myxococcota bacterium]